MVEQSNDWIDYWSADDFWKDSRLWEINSKIFFERANKLLNFSKGDRILDVGCGAGYTEAFLAPLVDSVTAVDVSGQFIDATSKKCRDCGNVRVGYLKKDDYTNLEQLQGPFSVILCVSVVQYYKSVSEIEALISSAHKIASPGARMLIADLPLERGLTGFIWDAVCSYWQAVRRGYSRVLWKAACDRWLKKTPYKNFFDKTKQLCFTTGELESLINRMNLDAEIIRQDFSVYANRLSLLIQF